MKKLGFLVLGLLCGAVLPLRANATIENGIYTVEGGHKTVILHDDTRGDIELTIASGDLKKYMASFTNYIRGFNVDKDNSVRIGTLNTPGTGTYIGEDGKMYGNTTTVNNAWGGGLDSITNRYNSGLMPERQGPCSSGRHVPSRGEWNDLVIAWCNLNSNCDSTYIKYATDGTSENKLVEIVDYKNSKLNKIRETFNMDDQSYWSSSPYPAENDKYAYRLQTATYGIGLYKSNRNEGYRVRCFKDSVIMPQTFIVKFFNDGEQIWGGEIVLGKKISEEIINNYLTGLTKIGYNFSGWSVSGNNTIFDIKHNAVTTGMTLNAVWTPINYEINYELNDGITSGENITGYTIESEDITLINPTKIGYTFTGWSGTSLDSLTTSVTIPTGSTGDREYEANWEINQYTITFKDGDNEITSITADYGTGIIPPANPTKNGYRFVGWESEVPATMPAENITINAKWDKIGGGSSGGGGGGGGGGSSSKTDTGSTSSGTGNQINSNTGDIASTGTNVKEPETNTGSSIQTGSQVDSNTGSIVSSGTNVNNPDTDTPGDSTAPSQNDKTYSTEFQEAYEFAKGNGITTMPTIQKANMEGKLTRIAMAKMLSQYAINVLGKTPDTSQSNKFNDITDKLDSDYDDGVTLAYQLGIMGQNMPGNNFRPNDEVTRAEFATALSRMAYNTLDGEYKATSKYYVHHMEKLVKEGIITNDDPNMKELRGYVMIMLMRSAK